MKNDPLDWLHRVLSNVLVNFYITNYHRAATIDQLFSQEKNVVYPRSGGADAKLLCFAVAFMRRGKL